MVKSAVPKQPKAATAAAAQKVKKAKAAGAPATAPKKKAAKKVVKIKPATDLNDKGKIKKATKPKRLPSRRNILRKARTSWIIFNTEQRAKLKQERPDLDFGPQSKLISDMWQAMTDEQKRPYNVAHEADQKRYEQDKANLTPEKVRILRLHRMAKKRARNERPRGALAPYIHFVNGERANLVKQAGDAPFPEVGRMLGVKWKTMSDEAKKPYFELARKDKERYLKERAAYDNAEMMKKEARKQAREAEVKAGANDKKLAK